MSNTNLRIPQYFQLVIQIFYDPSNSKAKNLSPTNTSWHEQCRNDLSALDLPFPPTSSLVCSVSTSIVQMAWNVDLDDCIVGRMASFFNPTFDLTPETQRELDNLNIHRMHLLERCLYSSGGETVALAGVLCCSKMIRSQDPSSHELSTARQNVLGDRPTLPSPLPNRDTSSSAHSPHSGYSSLTSPNSHQETALQISSPSQGVHKLVDFRIPNKRPISPSLPGMEPSFPLTAALASTRRSKREELLEEGYSSPEKREELEFMFAELQAELQRERNGRAIIEAETRRLQYLYHLHEQFGSRGSASSTTTTDPESRLTASLVDALRSAQRETQECKMASEQFRREVSMEKAKLEISNVLVERFRGDLVQQRDQVQTLRGEVEDLRAGNVLLHRVRDR
ncbi:hypothetical protein D9757_007844 [Collybiopsis confluens]|uniref:Uncharacterized protein n=1 Tax=Collybiopsis confluens TaxID=2823264 RepID=A0A8H5HD90_9AGAR|nr:hypothetical protein D9757_007844 [Collybiopsis confluens]